MDWNGKRVLVIGKGASGMAAVDVLLSLGAHPVVYDDYDHLPCSVEQYTLGRIRDSIHTFDCGILSPAIALNNPLVRLCGEYGIPLMSELDLAYTLCPGGIVAVTGTNGKTTTVCLVERLLRSIGINARAVGNIGVPFSRVAASMRPDDVAVVEVSSFMLEQSRCFACDQAAILNISPDHLQRHGSMQEYRRCKSRLLDHAAGYCTDADMPDLPTRADIPCMRYSLVDSDCDAYVADSAVFVRDGGRIIRVIDVDQLGLRGRHNLRNVLCALCLCVMRCGYRDSYKDVLQAYAGEPMRVQCVRQGRPRVYNDSKATNIAATAAAVDRMSGSTALLLGGFDKGEDYAAFLSNLPPKITHLIVFGQAASRIAATATAVGRCPAPLVADNVREAVRLAMRCDVDNVLFSPSCSSFDEFSGYIQRGYAFEEAVADYEN